MTKLTKKTTGEALTSIAVNFGLELKPQYINFIFDQLKDKISDQDFLKAVYKILNTEETFFNKMPPVATFLKYADKQELSIEQQAQIETARIITFAKGYISGKVIFDNPTTNAVASDYGINYIHNQLTNEWLDYRKGESTIRRELVERWLNFNLDKKQSTMPIKIDNDSEAVEMIGDKVKCQQMIDNAAKTIEQTSLNDNQKKINSVISKIGKK